MRRIFRLTEFAAVLLILGGGAACAQETARAAETTPPAAAAPRPGEWAQPVSLPGCPNLHKVSDNLYRGAQPSPEGFKELKKLGIKTVVNLRAFHSDRDEIEGREFNYVRIYMKAWHPEDEDVVRFLKVVADKKNAPVFVHCEHGADRTGTMIAVYRIVVEGWTKERAIKEMTDGGYGFHGVWQDLVKYLANLDADKLKRQAGDKK